MKKTLLATAVASVVTFGMANAATVYENEGFKLDLKGKVKGTLETTFAHHLGYNIKAMKAATGDFKDAEKMKVNLYANPDAYATTDFSAKMSGDFTIAPQYQINEGLKVFGGVTIKFTSSPKNYWTSDSFSTKAPDEIAVKVDDDGDPIKPTKASYLSFGGAQVGIGGTTILGKITLGTQKDALASYVGYAYLNKFYSALASLSYELGPVMGLNVLVGASLPLALVDSRPGNLNPSSTSGYTFGLKYDLELDKDMFVKAGFGYTSFTSNTKGKSSLNPEAYANWRHEIGLKLGFESEMFEAGLAYNVDFVPAHSNKDNTLALRTPANHGIKFNLGLNILEELKFETSVKAEFDEAAMGKNGDTSIIVSKGTFLGLTDKSKNRIANETVIEFEAGLTYTIAKGFTTGLTIGTESTLTSLAIDKDGKSNKDEAVNTVTAPKLTVEMAYSF